VSGATLVVPCYNEAARLDGDAFLGIVDAAPGLRLLFVDDGSTDATAERLREIASRRRDRVEVLQLAANAGKAEAVRQGLRAALAGGGDVVGYVDADLATPPPEILRLVRTMDERRASVVMGSRVALLGSDIRRSTLRHYTGRVFASIASLILEVRVYDTQCGAKLFRRSPALEAALTTPFLSRWAFDVELLGRLLAGAPGVAPVAAAEIIEMPLGTWSDVPGSKLSAAAMAGALKDLALIGADLRRRRRSTA
jgi:glycosyltransferase involved in cell wall biosynthesis